MKAINMKKMEFVTLFNSALNDNEEFRVMNIGSADLNASTQAGGSEELKKLLRERISNFFNGDILGYFSDSRESVTEDDVDYCINELAIGHASNIAGEDFYWGETEEVIHDIHKHIVQSATLTNKVNAIIEAARYDGFTEEIEDIDLLSYVKTNDKGEKETFEERFDYIDATTIPMSVHFICGTGHENYSVPIGWLTDESIDKLYECVESN